MSDLTKTLDDLSKVELADEIVKREAEVERLFASEQWLLSENAKLQEALESIANNTCCEGCQEAKRVALAALEDENDSQNVSCVDST